MRALLAVALLLPFAATAQSTAVATPFAVCSAMPDDAQRLACYDAAARGAAEQAPPTLYPADSQAAEHAAEADSLLDERWELGDSQGLFVFRAYKPVYLLPFFWSNDPNQQPGSPNPDNDVADPMGIQPVDTKFQLSFKTKVYDDLFGRFDVWTAFTQSSRWQVYDGKASRPFRETNYEPELMLVAPTDYPILGWNARMVAVALNHQSNGRANPFSRSWNRVIFNVGLERDGWVLNLRPWYRMPEGRRHDDNPDIDDYIGRADATLVRILPRGQQLSLMLRHSLRGGDRSHGALQFDWSYPMPWARNFRLHMQAFHGYGESLIDYNHRGTYIGLGISLMEWY